MSESGTEEADTSITVTLVEPSGMDPIVELADVTNATGLREQDDIVHDPNDPNLATNPEREWKFYFSARIAPSDEKRLFVSFSADGATWGTPTQIVLDTADRLSEDPSVCQAISPRGQVYRDGGGLMYLYVEDDATSDIYAYTSTDGINFTAVTSNPVIARGSGWEATLVGSPVARHDGTQFVIGYEGVGGGNEYFGMAFGVTADGLTKSANNPVWSPLVDAHADDSLVVDAMFKNDAGDKWVFLVHSGKAGTPTHWRGITSNMDPTTWQSGDIATVGGNISPVRNDLTLDNSTGQTYQLISGPADDLSLRRYEIRS